MTAPRARGRDWSSFQRPVTRAVVTGLSFGFVRVSNWVNGSMDVDANFPWDWKQLKAFGLVRGAYWYLIPSGGPSAEAQAQAFVHEVSAAGLLATDLLMADSEEDAAGVDAFTLAFLNEIGRLLPDHPKKLIGTYTNGAIGAKLTQTAVNWPVLWFAWPPSAAGDVPDHSHWAPAGWADWTLWQNGITRQPDGEQVDSDVFNGSRAELMAYVGSGPAVAPTIEEDPMLLTKGAGAITPLALPTGAKSVRFFASQKATINVDMRDGKALTELDLDFSSAHAVDIPSGLHAIVVHRVDDGTNDVSAAVSC